MEQAEVFTGEEPRERLDEPRPMPVDGGGADAGRPKRHKNRSRGSGPRPAQPMDQRVEPALGALAGPAPLPPVRAISPTAVLTEPAAVLLEAQSVAAASFLHEDLEPAVAPAPSAPAGSEAPRASCTMAQMRRFIKSRPYVPIHELRRRFEIEGGEDDVNPVPTDKGTIFVGLPPQEARFLSDLIRAGEVGCEMLLDPCSPGVIGVYAMRPVARQ
jgi:hypothetical protein